MSHPSSPKPRKCRPPSFTLEKGSASGFTPNALSKNRDVATWPGIASARQQHGTSTAAARRQHGVIVASARQQHGSSMASSWLGWLG